MASIDAFYNSDSRLDSYGLPLYLPPEEICPIKNGDVFRAIITVAGIAPSSVARMVAAGFYLNMPDGRKLWALGWGQLYANVTSIQVTAMSENMPWVFAGQPATYDSMGLDIGRTIDVVKQAVFVNGGNIFNCPLPGTGNWDTTVMASDSDADVYVNQTAPIPNPSISWINVLSAVPRPA